MSKRRRSVRRPAAPKATGTKGKGPKALLHRFTSAWTQMDRTETRRVHELAEEYKRFLQAAKTEREGVRVIEAGLKAKGYQPLEACARLKPGDKVYKNIRGRALVAAWLGDPRKPWRVVAAHLDSPRLDLKPHPLFEDAELGMLQTHYYGGIKKYQWVNIPLSLHGVVHTRQGKRELVVGERPGEPRFIIPDMPVHLAREQMNKAAREAVAGEQLRVVVGNRPLGKGPGSEWVKLGVLDLLHRAYGITERDLISADLTFVPAGPATDIGFDRALVAGYGQDDRICAFAVWQALLTASRPRGTALGLWVDKEETGSNGNTGAQSRLLENFAAELVRKAGSPGTAAEVLERATAISADVTEALNPNFKEISDARNASRLGGGITLEKSGGSGGKYDSAEASSEYMSWLIQLLDQHRIPWQSGELGKIDQGGGGTIAGYLARFGMETIDAGPAVLSMHSTAELSSKVDLTCTLKAYRVFFEA